MTPADPIPPPVTPEPLSEQELDELAAKAKLATNGPWDAVHTEEDGSLVMVRYPLPMDAPLPKMLEGKPELIAWTEDIEGSDAAFVAACSPDIILRLIAQARAARPSPTCATCKHLGRASDETGERYAYCKALRGFDVTDTPDNFGCTLHEPAPPAQDGATK